MTQANVCFKFKFGFCKFKERCVYRHVNIYHGKLDRKDENYVKQTSYDKDELYN